LEKCTNASGPRLIRYTRDPITIVAPPELKAFTRWALRRLSLDGGPALAESGGRRPFRLSPRTDTQRG